MRRLEESKSGETKEMLNTILWEEHKMKPQEWQLELAARQIPVHLTALYLRLIVHRVKDWVSSAREEECLRSLSCYDTCFDRNRENLCLMLRQVM